MEIKQLHMTDIEAVKPVILGAFSAAPWNDRWTDPRQFHAYMVDLMGNQNSLSLGLYDGEVLIGAALGRIKHWYGGNEYWIDDLAIAPQAQGRGCGSAFLDQIEGYLRANGVVKIVLFTNRDIPAYYLYRKKDFEERAERVFYQKVL